MSEKPRQPYSAGEPPSSECTRPSMLTMKTDALAWVEVHNLVVRSILANEGNHFQNGDQGHPTYRLGAETGRSDPHGSDGPDRNGIYQLLLQTSEQLGDLVQRRVASWQDFCKLAIEGYDQGFKR